MLSNISQTDAWLSLGLAFVGTTVDSAPGGCRRLLISLASLTQRGAPSFPFLAKGFEEVGRINNDKSARVYKSSRLGRKIGYPDPWYEQDPSDDEPRQLYKMPTIRPSAPSSRCAVNVPRGSQSVEFFEVFEAPRNLPCELLLWVND